MYILYDTPLFWLGWDIVRFAHRSAESLQ